jgi:hypothetical protein
MWIPTTFEALDPDKSGRYRLVTPAKETRTLHWVFVGLSFLWDAPFTWKADGMDTRQTAEALMTWPVEEEV